MTLRAQLLVIPCVSFAARARLASGSGVLTPIELLTLRAIGLGLDRVDILAQTMGLGTRVVLDLIYDFWLKGYVVVDTAAARVWLAGDAAERFKTGSLEQLATAENNLEEVPLVQELVTGAVLPHVGRNQPVGPPSALVPTEQTGLSLERVQRAELLFAVRKQVEHQSRSQGRPLSVQEAWVEPEQLIVEATGPDSVVQQRRFIPVWADIRWDSDASRLGFTIVEAPDLPPSLRHTLGHRLSELARRMPEQWFFKRLRQEMERAPAADEHFSGPDHVARLVQVVDGLGSTDPGVVDARHRQLCDHWSEACGQIQERSRRAAETVLVAGYERHGAEILRLIDGSVRQLVLGNPWISFEALIRPQPGSKDSWFDVLERALARGVQVFLLWGIGGDDTLHERVRNALVDLSSRHAGRLVFSRRSSSIHAKFVVRDAHEALITSFNFLQPSPVEDSVELGALVRAREPDTGPAAVHDLLVWSKNAFPDYFAAQRILTVAHDFGAAEPRPVEVPPVPELPPAAVRSIADGRPSPEIVHWEQAWRATAAHMQRLLDTSAPEIVDLLIDRDHRALLWQALNDSRARLAVLSDRLGVDVVTDRFVRALRKRLDEGVPCVFLYRREGVSDREDGPASRLRQEATRAAPLCRLVEAMSHAKVLITDDEVAIGSFNFLSYGGDYAGHGRERAELSFRIRSADVVEQVLSLLDTRWPDAFAPLRGRNAAPAPADVVHLPPKLQPLFGLVRAPRTDDALCEWFAASEDRWRELAELERSGVSADALHRAMAAAVATAVDIDDGPAIRWRARLALARWQEQDFIGSVLLLPDAGHPDCVLRPWLARLGAAVTGARSLDEELPDQLFDASRAEATAAAALLLVEVLCHGHMHRAELLEQLEPRLSGVAAAWPGAVARFCRDAGFRPLPLDLLRRASSNEQHRRAVAGARDDFRRDLEAAETVSFRFTIGEHTWRRLKLEGYLLGELRLALDAEDPRRLTRYFSSISDAEHHVERLMDEASHEERTEHEDRIDEPKRSACIKRLRRAVASARAWVDETASEPLAVAEAAVLAACAPLRRALDRCRLHEDDEQHPLIAAALRFARGHLQPLFDSEVP